MDNSPEGFGPWQILLTMNADSHLRQLRKKSPELFDNAVEKIRDLSFGHFSPRNHILISETENAVPIFKAVIKGKSRLVYQVDCILDSEEQVERQALRIFGVYTHAQMRRSDSFWNTVARDLARQGSQYRQRCLERSKPRTTGNNIFLPITYTELGGFSGSATEEIFAEPLAPPAVDVDFAELLAMHRIVVLSKPILNSLLAGYEIPFLGQPSIAEQEVIDHTTSCVVIGRSGTGKTWTIIYKIIGVQRAWTEVAEQGIAMPRQMFVTRSRMLADQVWATVSQLIKSFRLASLSQNELAELAAHPIEGDREGDRRSGFLPRRWSELEDKHFPLFVTFDELCSLLDADNGDAVQTVGLKNGIELEVDPESLLSAVSGQRFIATYWKHFPQTLMKRLDPMSVFNEFVGVIKGSAATISATRGYLDKSAYMELSSRTYPMFVDQRETLYDLFRSYLRLQRQRQERDGADRTHKLLQAISARLPNPQIDLMYIDEAQDNLTIDMYLLRKLCRNSNGIVWAGDTAQTIAVGSAFKFSELKATMHDLEKKEGNPKHVPPRTFHLCINYRSHAGIADCAQTIVSLIVAFWPNSIDRLDPERGWRRGPKPAFFGGYQDTGATFIDYKYTPDTKLTLGSEQCIIVRDENAKETLLARGITSALVLTVYQSKGLEFNDVLLYNMFGDSEVSHTQWRAICKLHTDDSLIDNGAGDRHRGVCRELKLAYVALTRARNRVWIVDDSEKALPMVHLWMSRHQIRVPSDNQNDEEIAQITATRSSVTDWAKQGMRFMDKEQYQLAFQCFEQADMPTEREVAHAYILRETAETPEQYLIAARKFEQALSASTSSGNHALRIACAMCYACAGDSEASAAMYCQAGDFKNAVRQYCKVPMMELARDLVIQYGQREVRSSDFNRICLYFLRNKRQREAMELFTTPQEAVTFLESRSMFRELVTYHEEAKNYEEAANVLLKGLNNLPAAVDMMFRDSHKMELVKRGTDLLLGDLWYRLSLTSTSVPDSRNKIHSTFSRLVSDRLRFNTTQYNGSTRHENELRMFQSIILRNTQQLFGYGARALEKEALDRAILAHDYAFTYLSEDARSEGPSAPLITSHTALVLKTLRTYVSTITTLCHDRRSWTAFQIRNVVSQPGSHVLPEGTFLHAAARMLSIHVKAHEEDHVRGSKITTSSLRQLLSNATGLLARQRVVGISEACKTIPILRPCVEFSLTGRCPAYSIITPRGGCLWEHDQGGLHSLNEDGLHNRLRIYLQIILTIDSLPPDLGDRNGCRAIWTERMYWMNALCRDLWVPFFEHGAIHMFNRQALIAEISGATTVLREWICEILFAHRILGSEADRWQIPKDLWHRAIPSAALLSYALDRLRDWSPATVCQWSRRSWQRLADEDHISGPAGFATHTEQGRPEKPGALLYLRFLHSKQPSRYPGLIAHLAQGLSTAFVITSGRASGSPLNKVRFVRGWLVNLQKLWRSKHTQEKTHADEDVDDFANCLSVIHASGTYHDDAAIKESGLVVANTNPVVANTVIKKNLEDVCRSLFLLGYYHRYFNNPDAKSRIVEALKGVPKGLPKSDFLVHAFNSNGPDEWDHLSRTVWRSVPRSDTWNHLVLVLSKEHNEQQERPQEPGPLTVIYTTEAELQEKLFVPAPAHGQTPTPFPKSWLESKPDQPPPAASAQHEVAAAERSASGSVQAAHTAAPDRPPVPDHELSQTTPAATDAAHTGNATQTIPEVQTSHGENRAPTPADVETDDGLEGGSTHPPSTMTVTTAPLLEHTAAEDSRTG
ncbi:hypothetical protein C8Q80DRAFT_1341060 [Daedaleopsis nitida]|nr:hypothetical protein C8Q80DRAFT_1341060 [Daedaleopsis nitida]